MKVFVAGATGATGRLLVQKLLDGGYKVVAVVRSKEKLSEALVSHHNVHLIEGSLLDFSDEKLAELVEGCEAIASCLGHNMSFKGMFGRPWRLVTNAVSRLCDAVKANKPEGVTKFVLMNSSGVKNPDLKEKISIPQHIVIWLLRLLVPPHADNEKAAAYLRKGIGQNDQQIEWVIVRPDGLINEEVISVYEIHPSPTRSAIFNSGKTRRINVAHFMHELISKDGDWEQWKGGSPVIYDKEDLK